MRYMLTFYAHEDEWMALPESERGAAIAEIGRWFAEHAQAGKIVEGHRLGRGTKTVRMGRVRKKDLPVVSDGPFAETEAIAIAERWPAGGIVEVRPLAD